MFGYSSAPTNESLGQEFRITPVTLNAKTAGNTNLYVIPTGKTLVITDVYVSIAIGAGTVTTGPTFTLGTDVTAQNSFWSRSLSTSTTDTTLAYRLAQSSQTLTGVPLSGRLTGTLMVNVGAAAGTATYSATIFVFGYLE